MRLPRLFLPLALALVALVVPATAQTMYTLGTSNCSPGGLANCNNVPVVETGTTVWVDLLPYYNPTSSRFITRIPGVADTVEVNNDSTYQVTYAASVTYTTPNGAVFIADIPIAQPQPACTPGQPCHTHQLPAQITGTFYELDVSNPLTGSFAVDFGDYYYVNQCSGRGCGGTLGWHVSTIGGKIFVNAPVTQVKESALSVGSPSGPQPEWGGYILVCGWDGVFPPYLPTGRIGVNGVQVSAQCGYYDTETGTYGNYTDMYWWIPWSTWFFPPAQTPYCESANYSTSACTQYANVPAIKASTPANPAQ